MKYRAANSPLPAPVTVDSATYVFEMAGSANIISIGYRSVIEHAYSMIPPLLSECTCWAEQGSCRPLSYSDVLSVCRNLQENANNRDIVDGVRLSSPFNHRVGRFSGAQVDVQSTVPFVCAFVRTDRDQLVRLHLPFLIAKPNGKDFIVWEDSDRNLKAELIRHAAPGELDQATDELKKIFMEAEFLLLYV